MELNTVQIIGLLALVMVIPLYQTLRNWRQHKKRQQFANAKEWRYTAPGWKAVFRSVYSIAGTTPSSIVWELRRELWGKQWVYVWICRKELLPYGKMRIVSRHKPAALEQNGRLNLRPVNVGSADWREAYVLLTSHDVLAEHYFNREGELALLTWPAWPAPGSLEGIEWQRHRLAIRVRYQNDLVTLDRIVILGTALVEHAAHLSA